VLGIAVVALSLATAGDADYIGAKKCKLCHKTEYASWEQTPHAKAFDNLKPEEQGKAECLKCHATGGTADLPGVQCEACHGPGSEYKSMKIMKDQEAAIAAGLILPDEALCVSCHEGAPHDVPPFNYEEAKKIGVHEVSGDE
jgi:nitrate/TMAO reductase-like tetraheme cytochrome c subunit